MSHHTRETSASTRKMSFFDRYLTVWVGLCMITGILVGKWMSTPIAKIRELEIAGINLPIALLIWLMIYPMMLKVDFASVMRSGKNPKGIIITVIVNWLVKPFSMAVLGWLFFRQLFLPIIGVEAADQYIAGSIILAAAPCTAMVFVWSYLTEGDPGYTLVQVAINDLILLIAFAPIVTWLVTGTSGLSVPFDVLLFSVLVFIVIPLAAGVLTRTLLVKMKGIVWFERDFLSRLHPIAISSLLLTLVLIFAFQAENLLSHWLHVILIAIPITIQVYFNASLVYVLMKWMKMSYAIAAPGALIGASNFFELAVATAIALYGPESGAALATVVGVLVEVPVMLSVCAICNRTRDWFIDHP